MRNMHRSVLHLNFKSYETMKESRCIYSGFFYVVNHIFYRRYHNACRQ